MDPQPFGERGRAWGPTDALLGSGGPIADLQKAPWRRQQQQLAAADGAEDGAAAAPWLVLQRKDPNHPKCAAVLGGSKCIPSPSGCHPPDMGKFAMAPDRHIATHPFTMEHLSLPTPDATLLPLTARPQLPMIVAGGTRDLSRELALVMQVAPSPGAQSARHRMAARSARGPTSPMSPMSPMSPQFEQLPRLRDAKDSESALAQQTAHSMDIVAVPDSTAVKRSELQQFSEDMGPLRLRWDARLWASKLQAALQALRGDFVKLLFQLASLSSEQAVKNGTYHVASGGPNGKRVDFDKIMARIPYADWYGRNNVNVALPQLANKGAKIPPPVLFTAHSALDVAVQLHRNEFGQHPIVLVAEVTGFDRDGCISIERVGSFNPECLLLRTDLMRFIEQARKNVRDGKSTTKDHLCASKDPYVFLCRNVAIFRGPREQGYPFLEETMKIQVIVVGQSEQRPVPQLVNSKAGWTEWYQSESGHHALLERLNLVSLVIMQELYDTGEPQLVQSESGDQHVSRLPIILMTFPGANLYAHPKDAVSNSLKHWRRRFTCYFHTAFVCTHGRALNGKETQMAMYTDSIVNAQMLTILESHAMASKAMPWHWDSGLIKMATNWMRLEQVAAVIRHHRAKNGYSQQKEIADQAGNARATMRGTAKGRRMSQLDSMTNEMTISMQKERLGRGDYEEGPSDEDDDEDSDEQSEDDDDAFDALDSNPINMLMKLQAMKEKEMHHPTTIDDALVAPKPQPKSLKELRGERQYRSPRKNLNRQDSQGEQGGSAIANFDLEGDDRDDLTWQISNTTIEDVPEFSGLDSVGSEVSSSPASPGMSTLSLTIPDSPKSSEKKGRRLSLMDEAAKLTSLGAPARRKSVGCGDLAAFIREAKNSDDPEVSTKDNVRAIGQILTAQKEEANMRRKSLQYIGGAGEIVSTAREAPAGPAVAGTPCVSRPSTAKLDVERSKIELDIRGKARKDLQNRRTLNDPSDGRRMSHRMSNMQAEAQLVKLRSFAENPEVEDLAGNLEEMLTQRRNSFAPHPGSLMKM